MYDVTVITSVYGTDALVDPPEQDIKCKWVCVSDRALKSDVWDVIIEPRDYMHPRHAAKVPKFRPDYYASTVMSLWVDGSVRLCRSDAVRRLIAPLKYTDIAMIQHPDRTRIIDEAPAALGQSHYKTQMIASQAYEYHEEMGDADDVLWATTVIARCHHNTLVRKWGDEMLLETMKWSLTDQVSAPYIAWKLNLHIAAIPEHLWTTELFTLWQRPIPST